MKQAYVVETAWEVCWQLGGIYTVLRSKAPAMVSQLGDHYCLVGPYNQATAEVEFEATTISETSQITSQEDTPFHRAAKVLAQRGIKIHVGRWLISGRPIVVLIDFLASWHKISEYKYFFWKDHQIDAGNEQEVNDVILFGYLVADFFHELEVQVNEMAGLPIIGHFHEWMGSVAIPVLRHSKSKVAITFTTHATLLGRYLASDDPFFYGRLPSIDPHKAAADRGIYNRFAIERAAVHGAHSFTTVSDITATEAEHLLGRKPDVISPNGLNIRKFAAVHESQNLHHRYKQIIHEFVMGHFFPSYSFDLDNTIYIFTAGRYEYRNKGMDLFIESLARLNYQLKLKNSQTTVIAFIITKAPIRAINVEVLKSLMMFQDLKHYCQSLSEKITEQLLRTAALGRSPEIQDLLTQDSMATLKRQHHAWTRKGLPAICTHDMQFDANDAVLNQLRYCHLFNAKEDKVKVIFHPEFLSSTSPLLGLDYDQFVRGAHLGVFPSYYEPWGYTPMECAALGVPSISSDLSGFGSYIKRQMPDHQDKGLFLCLRNQLSFEESADDLTKLLIEFLDMSQKDRIEMRNKVESTSDQFDWSILVNHYWQAYDVALETACRTTDTK